MFLVKGKLGELMVDETVRWIGYLGLLAVASFAVWKIISRVMG